MSFWKTIAGLISDTEARTVRVDSSTHSLQTVDYAHHEIHGGSHYFFRNYFTLASAGTQNFGVSVPSGTVWPHMKWQISVTGETRFRVYEGSVYTGGSNPSGTFNNNRNSGNTSILTIVSGPTITSNGTLLEAQLMGVASNPAQSVGGGSGRDHELILKHDTDYTFQFLSNSNDNNITFDASWYEHTDKD